MADELNDFPESTAAPAIEDRGFYSGAVEAVQAQHLATLAAKREAAELTPQRIEFNARQQRAADFHAAKQELDSASLRRTVADYAARVNAEHGNLHEQLRASLVNEGNPAPDADDANDSDFQADSFAREIGVDAAALGGVSSFEDVSTAAREVLGKLMDEISEQELLAAVQNSPAIANQFRDEAERELDRLASPQYGYRGTATDQQRAAREVAILNALRIGLAQTRRKSTVPPMAQLLSRARIAAGDQSFAAGKKGAVREFQEPADLPKSIHEVAAAMKVL